MSPELSSQSSWVNDINDLGQAVGEEGISDGVKRALHLDIASGKYTALTNGDSATGVNNLNQIVGWSGATGVFWSSPTSTPVELPPRGGDVFSYAVRINDAGIVIGASIGDDGWDVPVVWHVYFDEAGELQIAGPVELTFPLIDPDLGVVDLNEVVDGVVQVVGRTLSEAAIWTVQLHPDGSLAAPDPPLLLGTLGLGDPTWSIGYGINQWSDVCGYSDALPFVAPVDGPMQALPVPRDTLRGLARDLNDFGEIAGYVAVPYRGLKTGPGHKYASLWVAGARIDLSSQIPKQSGWDRLTEATAINNLGFIGGVGRFDVSYRGFLLIPNP
jgi:hypothetical protein